MSLLSDLHRAALATDERGDWQRLWQALAGTRLVVPTDGPATGGLRPRLVTVSGIEAVEAFDRIETWAATLASPGDCAEIDGAELAEMLDGHPLALAVTLEGEAEPILVSAGALAWIAATYRAEVDRAEAAGVRVSAPERPAPELVELLGQTVTALGPDCAEAWLVTLAPQDGRAELTLVLGLADLARPLEATIAETVTRAVQAGSDRPIAVACAAFDSALIDRARHYGIGISSEGRTTGSDA